MKCFFLHIHNLLSWAFDNCPKLLLWLTYEEFCQPNEDKSFWWKIEREGRFIIHCRTTFLQAFGFFPSVKFLLFILSLYCKLFTKREFRLIELLDIAKNPNELLQAACIAYISLTVLINSRLVQFILPNMVVNEWKSCAGEASIKGIEAV